jgi:hypothetical protein
MMRSAVAHVRLGSFASKHLSPLSNQGGHDHKSARRDGPEAGVATDVPTFIP